MKRKLKDQNEIQQSLYQYYEKLFPKKVFNSNEVIAHYLKDFSLPKLTKEQSQQCEGEITENAVKDALGNMICNKTPENDGLTSEVYKSFIFLV